jgi:hypothetical protein
MAAAPENLGENQGDEKPNRKHIQGANKVSFNHKIRV